MIIVSQDKDLVVNFKNVAVIGISEDDIKEIASITINGEFQSLGEYETEERAKEVLAEIVNIYTMIGVEIPKAGGTVTQLPIFEMPEE